MLPTNYDPETINLSDLLVQRRLQLQTELEGILGKRNVYFQPPQNTQIKYPCFIYNRSTVYSIKADDKPYLVKGHYSVTYIDPNPEACIAIMSVLLNHFDYISHERSFTSENLNHDVYNLYY